VGSQDKAFGASPHQRTPPAQSSLIFSLACNAPGEGLQNDNWRSPTSVHQHNLHSSSLLLVMHAGEGLQDDLWRLPHPTSVHQLQSSLIFHSCLVMHAGEVSGPNLWRLTHQRARHNLHSSSLLLMCTPVGGLRTNLWHLTSQRTPIFTPLLSCL
jgi:hypothetical protein